MTKHTRMRASTSNASRSVQVLPAFWFIRHISAQSVSELGLRTTRVLWGSSSVWSVALGGR